MLEAIRQAELARKAGDYAVGAVVVQGNKIISAASNRSKRDENPIAHAETLAILEASRKFGKRHLPDCVLYTTHEPCPMCAAVAVWARMKGIVYGARIEDMADYRRNNSHQKKFLWRTIDIPCKEVCRKSTEKVMVSGDFMREECARLFHC